MPEPPTPERIVGLVEAALALDPAARPAFLADACADDADLRTEVESLLRFERPARDFIAVPALRLHAKSLLADEPPRARLTAGDTLGGYHIVSLLGAGGMGEVYLAQDPDLGERPVAVKLIARGIASDALLRHFRQERLILAGLNHPHIARLYGGGVTADALPYFVMEYVEGEPIDTYCDRRGLGCAARLAIFLKVCAAVAYAHRRLVIHRDLKPANIRVTPEGEPKLLDFGIARLLADPQTGTVAEPAQPATLFHALTPAYASPEQLRGETMTTATDIYSLGVLLCELLGGSRPHRTGGLRPDEVARAICEQPAERPSLAAARADAPEFAARHGATPARVARQLRGDLDNIVLMALRKEPDRRYASVEQFAGDIERHRDGRPVLARRETLRYVTAKFVNRNRAAAVVAALLALSLLGGIAATSWQAHRAEQQRRRAEGRFEDVRRLADSLLFEIHDSVLTLPGSTPTRQLIVSRALEYLDRLSREADTPPLRRDLATAYEKIGDIQGNPFAANLGDTDGALASYRKAEALRESLRGTQTKEIRLELGRSYRALGDMLEVKGRFAEMIRSYRRSLTSFAELQRDFPADRAVRDEYARAYDVLGDGLSRAENAQAERLAAYEHVLAVRQQLQREEPGDLRNRRALALGRVKAGTAAMPDQARAVENIRQGIEGLRALAREQPTNARARREVAWGLFSLGNVWTEAGDPAAALVVRREALPLREQAAAEDPRDKQAQFDLAAVHADMAEALTGTGDPAQALGHADRSYEIMSGLLAADPANAIYARNAGLAVEKVALAHAALARTAGSDPAATRAHWEQSLVWYNRESVIFADLRDRKALRPADAGKLAELAAQIRLCEAEMVKLPAR